MSARLAMLCALTLLLLGCKERREREREPVSFAQVEPLLTRCTPCHDAQQAEGGYSVDSYYAVIGCSKAGRVLAPSNDGAPLLKVLDRASHAQLLATRERELLARWVSAGAPGRPGSAHDGEIMNPRAAGWHGKLAALAGFSALRDAEADGVCGRCHEGAPVRPAGVLFAAPGAPACTSCHSQAAGVLSCSTCHGAEQRAHPPRDACYFDSERDGHEAHVTGTRFRHEPLACTACHPVPGSAVFEGSHADGTLDLIIAEAAGSEARFDPGSSTCAETCHDRAGETPRPTWRERLPLDCNSCHRSPPPDHYSGACSRCHSEMGATSDSLQPGPLHLNGVVDPGTGSGTCGGCHGVDDDPWPRDRAHRAHRDSQLTSAIACETCHTVPTQLNAPGHLDGEVRVQLGGRAVASQPASFDAASGRCSEVACHGGALSERAPDPSWYVAPEAQGCESCHGTPPPPPHAQQPSCGGGLCHGAEVAGAGPRFGITAGGRALHIDGKKQGGAGEP